MSNERDYVPDIPEDVIRKNLLAMRQNNVETRDLCNDLKKQVEDLKNLVVMLQQEVQRQNQTVNTIRAMVQGTGSTS